MWPKRPTTIYGLLEEVYKGSSPPKIVDASGKRLSGRYWFHYVHNDIDYYIEKETQGHSVMIGRAVNPRTRHRPGWDEGIYYYEDVRTAIGDPELLVNLGDDVLDILIYLREIEPRIQTLFSDGSQSAVKRAQNNRVILQERQRGLTQ